MSRPLVMAALSLICFSVLVCFALPLQAADEIQLSPAGSAVKPPAGLKLGACSAVAVNAQGELFLFHRGKQPILCFDSAGEFLRSWGDDDVGKAHGLRIDPEGHVWTTDIARHVVRKYTPDGKLLLTLGTLDKAGEGLDQFNMPTDVAFGPGGEFYVSDGYGNSRVLKFTAAGKLIKTWGMKGPGPGEFNTPHAVRVGADGLVYVADRENKRIQIFDADGKLIRIWPGFAPYGLAFAADGTMFVADGLANKFLQLNSKGEVIKSWGSEGTEPGQFKLPHAIEVDKQGNVYVGDIQGERLQKFTRK